MALTGFGLTPSDGLKNSVSFPTSPASEAAARKQIQDVIDQVVADGNTLKSELAAVTGAAEIGCTGATANVQAFITATEAAGSGTTPGNDVITNVMMVSDVKIGSLAALIATITGTNRDNVVAAINFVVGLLGTYSLLTTTEKGNLVAAINEVNAKTASVLTTLGDIIVRGASDAQRLAIGTAYQSLNVNSAGNMLQYQASLQSIITAAGDLIYGSAANTPARLAKGTDGQILGLASGLPAWETKFSAAHVSGTDNDTSIPTGAFAKTIALSISAKVVFLTLYHTAANGAFVNMMVTSAGYKIMHGTSAEGVAAFSSRPSNFSEQYSSNPWASNATYFSSAAISGTNLVINLVNSTSVTTARFGWNIVALS